MRRAALPLRRDGWVAFALSTVARCYLVLLAALAAIATLPLLLGWSGSVVQSGSMEPHVQPGDVVLTAPLTEDQPIPLGGVVQFRAAAPGGGERLVVHRIVRAGDAQGEWVTAGDANAEVDSTPITRADITGQGRVLVRWVGLPAWWWGTGQALPLAGWAGTLLLAVGLVLWARDDDGDSPAREPRRTGRSRVRRPAVAATAATLMLVGLAGTTIATAAPAHAAFTARTSNASNTFRVATWPTLTLGRAATYAVLAATSVVNAEVLGLGSSVEGSVGVSPGTGVSGFWPWDITGSTDRNTAGAIDARTDAIRLYDTARTRTATGTAPASLTGTIAPGVLRRAGSVQVTGTLTLDAKGDPSATFVLQGSSLSFASGAQVVLKNGAQSDNVLFVSTSTLTVADSVRARGVLLASGDVTLARYTTLEGRAFSLNGGVSLTRVTVTQP